MISTLKNSPPRALGGSQGAVLASRADGSAWVYKPFSSQELAAYHVSEILGLGLVPETQKVSVRGRDRIASRYVAPTPKAEITRNFNDLHDVGDDIRLFDVLIGNVDRHNENWILTTSSDEKPRRWAIDHDRTFVNFAGPTLRGMNFGNGTGFDRLPLALQERPNFVAALEKWTPLQDASLRELLSKEQLEAVERRRLYLLREAKAVVGVTTQNTLPLDLLPPTSNPAKKIDRPYEHCLHLFSHYIQSCEFVSLDGKTQYASDQPLLDMASRFESLAYDPAPKSITPGSVMEAAMGLFAEYSGVMEPPSRRDPSGAAEFIDARGVNWDVKCPLSSWEGQKWEFDAEHQLKKVSKDLVDNGHVLLNLTRVNAADEETLLSLLRERLTPEELSRVVALQRRKELYE